ncbi:MAG: CPBP family intramembrane glutamic endopeptidase [Bacteroidota bacterium]
MKRSDHIRLLEVFAVALTGIGKFLFMDILNWRLPFILSACLFWMAYIFYRYQKEPAILGYWGLTREGFGKTFWELLPVALISILSFVLIGEQLGTNILSWHILPILLVYPLWGIIQQFLIIGLIARNLQDMDRRKFSIWSIVLITAIIFAIVHYPFILLIIGTFLLAVVYTLLYLKGRNLLVLGIYHGWIGAFFFYTILYRDPWLEVFAMLSS